MGNLLFILYMYLSLSKRPTHPFSVTGVPDTLTLDQTVTFTWFWAPNDPTSVVIAQTRPDAGVAGVIATTMIGRNGQTQGVLTFSVKNIGIRSIVGYDLDHVDFRSIIQEVLPRLSFFFDDRHQIDVIAKDSTPPRTTAGLPTTISPATTLSSPGGSLQGQALQMMESQQCV
ncbi:hypothetical protein PM082_015002 [Marasmius tenuissimus]|nr:hypothetical protein PM082_015002 [Marasmius tenuissimus]